MAQGMTAGEADRAPSHPLERLIFFSDAVFAIAITLLIIEVKAPHLPRGASTAEQLGALFQLIPHLVGFFVSFAVIGLFWVGHHRAFSLSLHWSPKLLFANLSLLCLIAFMPFATAYMNSNIGQSVPTAFYCAVLLATGLLNRRLVRLATGPGVVSETADPVQIAETRARGWGVIAGAALALVLALFVPNFALVALAAIPFVARFAVGRARRRAAAEPSPA